jgi:Tol biopolymer transport system component
MEPRWSPDGSTIVFSRSIPRSARDGKGDATRIKVDADIYSVRQDGSGLTALTSDGVSFEPIWTGDGRIAFRKMQADGRAELWVMDADGTNATRLDTTIAAQSAARCTVCPYDPTEGDSSQDGGPFLRFWRPGQP